jgi:hypothetical protein
LGSREVGSMAFFPVQTLREARLRHRFLEVEK